MVLLWLLLACASDPCTLAIERQEAAVRACGGELLREPWHGNVCSDAEAALYRCEARCMEGAHCGVLSASARDNTDVFEGHTAYLWCMQTCPTPW